MPFLLLSKGAGLYHLVQFWRYDFAASQVSSLGMIGLIPLLAVLFLILQVCDSWIYAIAYFLFNQICNSIYYIGLCTTFGSKTGSA